MSASFPCRRCGAAVPIPDAARRDPAATLICPACGQRYARRKPAGGGSIAPATGGAFTSGAPVAKSAQSDGAAPTPAQAPTRSLPAAADRTATFEDGAFVANRYRVVRFIARGGMGEVYEAEDLELRCRVALKTVHAGASGESGAIERLKREIQLARRVTHPNVCRIFDVGFHSVTVDAPPLVFLTMELLEGETLAARLRRAGRMSTATALPIVRQLTGALQAAHDVGVVHRDFKSENVFLVPGRDGERAVVTDFGIARGGDDGFGITLTSTGNAIGTPAYMAPEQISGGEIGSAVDQYALGVVMFEMVTGELPFRGENALQTAARRLTEPPPSPRQWQPELDPLWEAAILRCLARRPEERFRDVAGVARALAGEASVAGAASPAVDEAAGAASPPATPAVVQSEPHEIAEPARARRVLSPAERRKRWLAALLLVALAGASAWAWVRVRAIRQRLAVEAPVAARRSVAVLGLRNLAGRADAAWLSTALAEMLDTELGQGRTLRVIPGEDVSQALADLGLGAASALPVEARARLRRRLGADYLVTGGYTVLADGDALRLDLRLEDARSSETLTTIAESGRESQLFDLVARAGGSLRSALGAGEARASKPALPTSPVAAKLYAEGIDALRHFDPRQGRQLLEEAVAADPDNALAHSALATALGSLGYSARAEQEASRARELATELPDEERLVVEARYFEAAGDWGTAASNWARLWSAYPDNVDYGLRVAACRTRAGQADQALAAALALRNLPAPENEDPRIDLAEASASGALSNFRRQAEAAERAATHAEARGAPLLVAEALVSRAWALRNLGRGAEGRAAAERARDLYQQAGDRAGVATAEGVRGAILLDLGSLDAARDAYQQALSISRELGDRGGEARALNNLAVLARSRGELDAARQSYERVLAITTETGDRVGAAVAANNLASILADLGEFEEASKRAREAIDAARASGDKSGLAAALGNLGAVERRQGDLTAAERDWGESLALRRETGQRPGEAGALCGLAQTLLEHGQLDAAATRFADAAALARELGARSALATALSGQGEVAARHDDTTAARNAFNEALSLRRTIGEARRSRPGAARAGAARPRSAAWRGCGPGTRAARRDGEQPVAGPRGNGSHPAR